MSLTLTLTATSAYDLREQILALAAAYSAAVDPVVQPAPKAKPAEVKNTKHRNTFADRGLQVSAPEPVDEPEPVSAPEPEPVPEAVQETPRELTFDDDITPAVLNLVNTKGRDAIIGVLSSFGVSRASECNIAVYPELLAALLEAAQ